MFWFTEIASVRFLARTQSFNKHSAPHFIVLPILQQANLPYSYSSSDKLREKLLQAIHDKYVQIMSPAAVFSLTRPRCSGAGFSASDYNALLLKSQFNHNSAFNNIYQHHE